ncbi:MAG: radical SAM protein [Candidatus Omnitrophota bacterium]|nr:MAG: radical SAM protein [Candidatus Omnitrophota bacterium]
MNILAINPWIYDFAAYDFWLKPYGFLVILTYLKNKGINVDYIDCLDKKITKADFGRGKYPAQIIEKPSIFKQIPRHFKRYGISIDELKGALKKTNYDYILITSSMTYWYPAIIDLIKILRAKFGASKIILGGTYATLCYGHAKKTTGCDFVFKDSSLKEFFSLLNVDFNYTQFYSTLPSYEDFYTTLDYVVLRTCWGCPFDCSYCAIKELFTGFFRVPHKKVIEFIAKYHQSGIKNFILYDDAFLYEPNYAKQLLRQIINLKLDIHFHTPNALHLKFLDKDIACLLKKSNFINPHFGLETLNPYLQKLWGDKVNKSDLRRGVNLLKKGGFRKGEFSVYLLLGYPNQNLEELKKEVDMLHCLGAKVSLAEFSPVPKTKIFQNYKDNFNEPLSHNNSVFGSFQQDKIKDFWEIKNYVRQLNKELSLGNKGVISDIKS